MAMACSSSLQPRLLSSIGDRFVCSTKQLRPLLPFHPGNRHVSMQHRRILCNLVDILFNRSNKEDDILNGNRKRLRPGKVSPRLTVPDHIMQPPYVDSRRSPQISSGPEIHDKVGIECMRASGRLAAQVLEYAGTLVKVMCKF